jgi:zinc protease
MSSYNQILDRKQRPQLKDFEQLNFVQPQKRTLSNGIDVYIFEGGTRDIVKIEWLLKGGSWEQKAPLEASTTARMLIEGSKNKNAKQIAEQFAFYGAQINFSNDNHHNYAQLAALNKHIPALVDAFFEVMYTPTFPENELDIMRSNGKQSLKVQMEKVEYLAKKRFNKLLYGEGFPYGNAAEEEHYNALNISTLKNYHEQFYVNNKPTLLVSGKGTRQAVDLLEKQYKQLNLQFKNYETRTLKPQDNIHRKEMVVKTGALQNAIQIGQLCISHNHPDFHALRITNTLLGGYFGSRLMSNIREEKGYTYGISSRIAGEKMASAFSISTETGAAVTADAVREIYKEIEILQTQTVSLDELTVVKKYLEGNFISSFDGPFALSDRFKSLIINDLDYNHYISFLNKIKNISTEEVQAMAQKHLDLSKLTTVVAGSEISF